MVAIGLSACGQTRNQEAQNWAGHLAGRISSRCAYVQRRAFEQGGAYEPFYHLSGDRASSAGDCSRCGVSAAGKIGNCHGNSMIFSEGGLAEVTSVVAT
jgi:hypothetical protein